MVWKSSFRQNYRTTFSPTVPTSAAGISHVVADVEAPGGEKWERVKSGGKQWQSTPKNLPRMQRTRATPVAWLNSGLCPDRPKGWIPIIIIIIMAPHTNCNVVRLSVCELTWNFLQTISTEMKQGVLAEQNKCLFYISTKHTMTDPVHKIQSQVRSSVTTWDANAAVCLHVMLMILTLSFAVLVEPVIFLKKSTVQHCYHLSRVFCICCSL